MPIDVQCIVTPVALLVIHYISNSPEKLANVFSGDDSDLAVPHSKKKVKKRKVRDAEGGVKSKKPRKKKGKKSVEEQQAADDTYFDASTSMSPIYHALLYTACR